MKEDNNTSKQLIKKLEELRKSISDLKKSTAERTVEKNKSYQFIVESANDAIFFKDLKSRYVIVNTKTLEVFRLSKEEVIGKNDYFFDSSNIRHKLLLHK